MTLSEAHKTGRKYRRKNEIGFVGEFHRVHVGSTEGERQLIETKDAIADDWEVEPEVYEVECDWVGNIDGAIAVPDDLETNNTHKPMWKRLVGKRTKLTIEVLD
jgi:hypothetical protein